MATQRIDTALRLDVCLSYLLETSKSEERNAFVREKLLPYLQNGGTWSDTFASADEFRAALGLSKLDYYYTYSDVSSQVKRFYTDVKQVILHNDDVYFDFKSDVAGSDGMSAGMDTFYNFTDSYDAFSVALTALHADTASDADLDTLFDSVRIAKFDEAQAFDVDAIPFETFDTLAPEWGNGDINGLMNTLGPWSKEDATLLIESLFKNQADAKNPKKEILIDADFIGKLAGPIALDPDSALKILARANEIWNGFRDDMRTKTYGAKSEGDKISRQNYLETMSEHALGCLEALTEFDLDGFEIIETALAFPYLTPAEIAGIARKLPGNPVSVYEELKTFSGLSLDDINAIVTKVDDHSFSAQMDADFDDYFGKRNDKFLLHRSAIEATYKKAAAAGKPFEFVTPEVAQILIFIESTGKGGLISSTGHHFGLMQVGLDACNTVLSSDISEEVCKQKALGDYRWNIDQGMHYLEYGFTSLNPTNSFANAMGNYNGGAGTMISYKKGHMYAFGSLAGQETAGTPLKAETRDYIAKFMYCRRLLAASPDYQAWCAQNGFTRQVA
jgi:hypothetical protein